MQDLLYIKVDELFWIVQDITGSTSSDTVTITITRLSDNYTWNFTDLEFTSASTSGTMTFVSGILWKASFTPDQSDTYIIKIVDGSDTFYQTLIAKGGSEVLPFATASDVAICNLALVSLGADTIMALTEDSENARKLNAVYALIRDEVLRAFPWNFAIRWAELSQLSETPVNDFTYAYQLPTDPKCLKVIKMNEDIETSEYRIENGKLYTDESAVTIEYIAQVTDAASYDSSFVTAFAARLAAELAYAITGSESVRQSKWDEYTMKIREARGADSQEGRPEVINSSDWIDSRDSSS